MDKEAQTPIYLYYEYEEYKLIILKYIHLNILITIRNYSLRILNNKQRQSIRE